MSLLSIFKKISFVLAINLIISPIFFIQAKIVSAKEEDNQIDGNNNSDIQGTNFFTSILNKLSVQVYCGISGIFINSCELQGTQIVKTNNITINKNNTTQVINRNENRTDVTNLNNQNTNVDENQTVVQTTGGGLNENFVTERINELATILRNEIRNNAIYSTGPQGPQGVAGPVGPRGAGGGGGRGRDGATGPQGPAGADAFVSVGAEGYILQSTGTTTQWVATSSLGIGIGLPGTGTVTSVAMSVPTGLSVTGGPITSSGTFAVSLTSGYIIPTTASTTNWNTAFGWGDHSVQGYLTSLDLNNLDPVVVGKGNNDQGTNSSIFGRNNIVDGLEAGSASSTALGISNYVLGNGATAVGYTNSAYGDRTSAFGYDNDALKRGSSAFGYHNTTSGNDSSAFGFSNTVSGFYSSAFGYDNTVAGYRASASGYSNTASGDYTSVVGFMNNASAQNASIFGSNIVNAIASSTMVGPSNSAKITILNTGEFKAQFINATSTTATSSFNGAVNVKSALLANGSAGTTGYVLQTTGTGVQWVATSSLGISSSFDVDALASIEVGNGNISTTTAKNVFDTIELSSSIGISNTSSAAGSSAFGNQNTASGYRSVSYGVLNSVAANNSVAVGKGNTIASTSPATSVFGVNNTASAGNPGAQTIIGYNNTMTGGSSSFIGGSSNTSSAGSNAIIGYNNISSATGASIFGSSITNAIANSVMIGPSNSAKVTILSTGEFKAQSINATSTTATSSFSGAVDVKSSLLANGSAGTNGYVLQTTGTGVQWVATSSLGITGGGSTDVNALSPIAVGLTNVASGTNASAFGYKNNTQTLNSVLVGNQNFTSTTGLAAVSFGLLNNSTGVTLNTTTGVITGTAAATTTVGRLSTTVGVQNISVGNTGVAVGYNNLITSAGINGVALGNSNQVWGSGGIAVGTGNFATGSYRSIALGAANSAQTQFGVAAGYSNYVTGHQGIGVGIANQVSATSSSAFGTGIINDIESTLMIGPDNLSKLTILSTANGGYVGVGTTTPDSSLHVVGREGWGTALTVDSDGDTGDVAFKVRSNSFIPFITDSNTRFIVLGNGNVGVGTSTPTARFSVRGDSYITGAFRDSTFATGTAGYVLQSTGTSTLWVATSTLGISGGAPVDVNALSPIEVGFGNTSSALYASAFGSNVTNTIANSVMMGPSDAAKVTILNTGEFKAQFINATSTTATSTFNGAVNIKSTLLANGNAGTAGYILQNTGTGVQWVATSSIGLVGGGGGGNVNALSPIEVGFGNTAAGYQASAFGYQNTASGYKSLATGWSSESSGIFATASGYDNTASGDRSTAAGYFNTATQLNASAFGSENNATATSSTAIGRQNGASGVSSSALGMWNTATALESSAVGYNNHATAANSAAFGLNNFATAANAVAFGNSITNSIANSVMIGNSDSAKITILSTGELQANFITSTSSATSTFNGPLNVKSKLFANGNAGVAGYILQSTGTGVQWTATSSLGIVGGGGGSTDVNALAVIAVGDINTSSGYRASAFGYNNNSTGDRSLTLGHTNTASGIYSVAIGRNTITAGDGAVAIGNANISAVPNTASASYALAIGIANTSSGQYSSSFGHNNTVSVNEGMAFGISNTVSINTTGMAFGNLNTVSGFKALAIGSNNTASGDYATASGYQNTASAQYSSAFGSNIINNIASSTMVGPSNSAKITILSNGNLGVGTSNPGYKLTVAGDLSLTGALRINNNAGIAGYILQSTGSGIQWVATSSVGFVGGGGGGPIDVNALNPIQVGAGNTASGSYSSGMGYQNTASGSYSSAFGYQNNALYESSAFGYSNNVQGENAAAFGFDNTVSTYSRYSNALGVRNTTSTYSWYASAVGYQNTVSAQYSASAFGSRNFANASYASAFGYQNIASTTNSTALGYSNIADADNASAVGYDNSATGINSSAFGNSNIVSGERAAAFGYQNTVSGYQGAVIGAGNTVGGSGSTAVGENNTVDDGGVAVGSGNTAVDNLSGGKTIAVGHFNQATGGYAVAIGWANAADAYAVAMGNNNTANGTRSGAIGFENSTGADALAFGQGLSNFDDHTLVIGMADYGFGGGPANGIKVYANTLSSYVGASIELLGYGAGTLTTNGFGIVSASSDEKLKDIEKMYDGSLEALRQINPIVYKWNDKSGLADGLTYIGFSAQNIQTVIPEAVNKVSNGNLSLQDRPIMALTINAVKDLDQKISWMSEYVSQSADGIIAFFKELTVDKLNINGEVCVDDVCVTKEEFKTLLQKNGGSVNVTSDSSLIAETPSNATSTATTSSETGTSGGGQTSTDPESSVDVPEEPVVETPAPVIEEPVEEVVSEPVSTPDPVPETPTI